MDNREDLKIICPEDCGNSPKARFLKEWNIAMAQKDEARITECIADEVQWNIIGDTTIQGKGHFFNAVDKKITGKISEFHIQNIITHGRIGSVNGLLIFEDQKRLAFCHVCRFTSAGKNAKIKEITTYVIET